MKKLNLNHKIAGIVNFRRWGRHKFSLFQALNKQVRIAVLVVTYFLIPGLNETFAQADSLKIAKKYDLDEIEVSAQRAPVTYSQVARIVSVIDQEQIEAAPVTSVQDLLEYAMGVDIRQRGANGVQADVSIRGGSFDQTLILLNGINISDPQTGHHNLNLPVSLKNIKRIEILEGPGARVYGPNAFSGAINIVTEPSQNDRATVDLTYGEHQLRDVNVSANKKYGKLDNLVAFDNRSSAGYIKNTDFDIYNFFYHGRLHTEEGRLDIQFGHTDKAFGANSFYTPKYPNQFEQTKTTFAALKFETGKKLHFSPSVYWRRNQDRFELFRHDSVTYPFNYHLTDVLGTSINSW
ncbi:MAG TPA: TonB-dependent receptor plug domain-containing protein, partial [Sunxiuqinia sp.]|nr:TonB-dependent receptor plug domain-containing protein [Sunxiuqinia sp.]